MNPLFNKSTMISIAKREHNTKRSYLIINPLQGKHIPVNPTMPLTLFQQMGNKILEEFPPEHNKFLVIGFAETATAIGAGVADALSAPYYIHTTREVLEPVADYLCFSEEHSHATEQKLYCTNLDKILNEINHILFVEDEITTGKTILNFISVLRKSGKLQNSIKISAISIMNGMSSLHKQNFADENVGIYYLAPVENSGYSELVASIPDEVISYNTKCYNAQGSVVVTDIHGAASPRQCLSFPDYKNACLSLAQQVIDFAGSENLDKKTILVLGTEEFMYPAMITASKIQKNFPNSSVVNHATTRSPIIPLQQSDYPIKERFEIRSCYDSRRSTFVYNLQKYDLVIVLTDCENPKADGLLDIDYALKSKGNHHIIYIRWVC